MFQSTHPRRVRLPSFVTIALALGFNPRTHVGCDAQRFYTNVLTKLVSIHAPT